ncbi:hypothetical protein, partial [Mycobacterium sp.]|uniref:hypothetical protein n=1 Tax=Mycobacterium sp. TaxID=1785 RepID=UPI002C5399A4
AAELRNLVGTLARWDRWWSGRITVRASLAIVNDLPYIKPGGIMATSMQTIKLDGVGPVDVTFVDRGEGRPFVLSW